MLRYHYDNSYTEHFSTNPHPFEQTFLGECYHYQKNTKNKPHQKTNKQTNNPKPKKPPPNSQIKSGCKKSHHTPCHSYISNEATIDQVLHRCSSISSYDCTDVRLAINNTIDNRQYGTVFYLCKHFTQFWSILPHLYNPGIWIPLLQYQNTGWWEPVAASLYEAFS